MKDRKDLYANPFFEPDTEYTSFRFHVLGVPQTPTHSDFSADAFAQNIRMLCWGLKSTGHTVFHYGNELSLDRENPEKGVLCDEHISVTTEENLMEAYPNCREQKGIIDYLNPEYPDEVSYLNEIYCLNTARAVRKRFRTGDYICYGIAPHSLHSRLASLVEAYHIESAIGYLAKPYLPYKIFASQALQGWHYGAFASDWDYRESLNEEEKKHYVYNLNNHISFAQTPLHDAVIPFPLDIKDYDFRLEKEEYLLYLGRIHEEKGIDVALKIAERLEKSLVIAGTGDFEKTFGSPPDYVELVGPVGVEQRRELISKAFGVLTLSRYWEPFNIVMRTIITKTDRMWALMRGYGILLLLTPVHN